MHTPWGPRNTKDHSCFRGSRWIIFLLVAFQGVLLFKFFSSKPIDDAATRRPANRISDVRIVALDVGLLEGNLEMSEDHELLKEVVQHELPEMVHRSWASATNTINVSIIHEQGARFPVAEDELSTANSIALESDIPPTREAVYLELADSVRDDEFNNLLLRSKLGELVERPLGASAQERSASEEAGGGVTTCLEQGWDLNGGGLLGRGTYGSVAAAKVPVVVQLCELGPSEGDCKKKATRRATVRHPHILDFLAALGDGSKIEGVVSKSFSNETLAHTKVTKKGRLSQLDVASVGFQISSALEYLHARGSQGINMSEISVQSRRHTGGLFVKLVEVPLPSEYDENKIVKRLDDVFALGKLLLSLLGADVDDTESQLTDGVVGMNKDLKDTIESCVYAEAGDRPSSAALAEDFEGIFFQLVEKTKGSMEMTASQDTMTNHDIPSQGFNTKGVPLSKFSVQEQGVSTLRQDAARRRRLSGKTAVDPDEIDLSLATVDCMCGFNFGGVQSKESTPPAAKHECPWSETTPPSVKGLFHIQRENISGIRRAAGFAAGYFLGHYTVALKTHEDKFRPGNMEEMIIHSELVHPNIIQFLGVAVGRTNVGWLPTGFVLESFPEGSLHTMLSNESRVLPYAFRLEVALQFAQSLAYLHEKKIVHFDIKPHNVLVRKGSDHVKDTAVKLIDFGFSLKMDGDWLDMSGRSTKRHVWGTRKYAAPELFVNASNVTEKADVFSFGVTLWKMYTQRSPRSGLSKEEIMQRWRNGTMPELRIPSSCEREWAELIRECTKTNAVDRPSMETIVHRISMAKSVT